MQVLLRHDGFHADLSPSPSCQQFPTTALSCPTSTHAAATAVPLKSQCRSRHPAAQNPSVLPALPTRENKVFAVADQAPHSWPRSCDQCPPHSLLCCCSGLLKPVPDSSRCPVSHLEAPCTSSSFCLGISRKLWPSSEASQR